jgi:hypothetical protein
MVPVGRRLQVHPPHRAQLLNQTSSTPILNQIELHPHSSQDASMTAAAELTSQYASQEANGLERHGKEQRRIMDDTLLERLGAGKYMLLTSYRKNGTPVATPVWVVRDGDTLGVRTPADSWKVKRIRARGDILVGPCDLRGNPTGDQVPATAEIVDEATGDRYRSLIARKYGILGRLMILDSRLRGGNSTLGILVRLAS